MCNLYSLTRTPEELRRAFRIMHDRTGNLPPLPDVFPDQLAPVVRTGKDGERELTMMRWGFPPPPALGTRPVTNVRNVKSPYWRGWLKPDFRCLVPATSFCEYTDSRPNCRTGSRSTRLALSSPLPAFGDLGRARVARRQPLRKASTCCSHS